MPVTDMSEAYPRRAMEFHSAIKKNSSVGQVQLEVTILKKMSEIQKDRCQIVFSTVNLDRDKKKSHIYAR